ncbi:MAG: class I SAM-dependent methyltransferase [Bryobacterales bacterium]|nr:class I SAM-dependent methyltransferase [Bryobacterales bacterium]
MGEADSGGIGATALRVAVRRAAHQLLDEPRVFEDPLALGIIGEREAAKLRSRIGGKEREWNNSLRAWIAARSRYAEDRLAEAVRGGVSDYVVLGAGLDTFAYRNPYDGLRVWEVDLADAQAAKRRMLGEAGIRVPDTVRFVAVDFERESLRERLDEHGFAGREAFVSWLGVTPFLGQEAFARTLRELEEIAAQVVFDYAVRGEELDEADRFAQELIARRVAAAGEPYRLSFSLGQEFAGFRVMEDLGKDEVNARYFGGRGDGLRVAFTATRLVSCVPAKRCGSRVGSVPH